MSILEDVLRLEGELDYLQEKIRALAEEWWDSENMRGEDLAEKLWEVYLESKQGS